MDDHTPTPTPGQQPGPPPSAAPSTGVDVCYRHSDRQTRLSCSACGRPICVDCVRQAAVGQKCPECAQPEGRNRVITAREIRERRATDGAPVTTAILGVTIAIGAIGLFVPALWIELRNALVHNVALVESGEWWRLVSAALLHSRTSIFHIVFNMWALYVFGPQLERQVGSLPFATFYVAAAAAGGAAFQITSSAGSALGASGAIFGLFGAWIVAAYMQRHTHAGRANLNQLLILLGINLALPLIVPGIAWEAHLGGLLAGMVVAGLWTQLRNSSIGRTLVAMAVLATSLTLVLLL